MDIIQEAIVTAGGVLATALVAYLLRLANEATARIKDERLRLLVEALVAAAEKQFGRGAGAAKLAYVADVLAAKGIDPERADVRAMIEANVLAYDIATPPLEVPDMPGCCSGDREQDIVDMESGC